MNKEKIKSVLSNCKKKVLGAVAGAMTVVTTAVTSFAAEGGSASFSISDISTVLDPIKSEWTFAKIAAILALAIGACVGLVLGWFGLRKVISMIQRALKKGRLAV